MKKNKKFLILSTLAFLLITSFGLLKITLAQNNAATQGAVDEIDAIGVRILPNPNHYSIARWYQSQGFYGSPQSLIVDGYEAIRDGRTVYVSAANVTAKDVYTNIYLISYNQDPSRTTVDILGQIISRWKFNNNLESSNLESQATCSISSISCSNNSDCGQGRICITDGPAGGSCQLQEIKNCRSDSDCPTNFFCDSDKAKITRDMKRIGRLGEMKEALANYYQAQGKYPLLESGTYLTNKSVSLWPSWQQVLLSSIAVSPNFVDPINRLGACPGFDIKTCWNINENRFYSSPVDNTLTLPAGSYAMVYATDTDGANYNLCATLESRHPSLNYNFVGSNLNESLCVSDIGVDTSAGSENNAPVLVDYNLSGQTGKEFNGYIKVYDANNDPLKWEIIKGQANWGAWSSDVFKIIDTSNKFQKKIFASLAPGTNSSFPITLRVSDSRGGVLQEDLLVDIQDYGIFIEAQNIVHVLDKNVSLLYSFHVSGDNLNNPPNVRLRRVSGSVNIPFQLSERALVSENRYLVTFVADLDPRTYQFPENTDFEFEVIATDKSAKEFKKSFNLRLISEKPVLQFACANKTRVGQNYSCLLGKTNYFGRGFRYQISGQPSDLRISTSSDPVLAEAYISGRAQATVSNPSLVTDDPGSGLGFNNPSPNAGSPNQIKEHTISVSVTSDYGAVTNKNFNLTVNNFCGDGILQLPNSEGRGGINNDGYEQCDGKSGTTANPAESSENRQYACTTFNSETPLEIASGNYCVFKSSLSGGGYCGDNYCQTKYETKNNCSNDCSDGRGGSPEDICNFNADCEAWEECHLILRRCIVAPDYCKDGNDCASGFECIANKCEAKIFNNLETINVIRFREGDATRAWVNYYQRNTSGFGSKVTLNYNNYEITEASGVNVKICDSQSQSLNGCTIIKIDDPYCADTSDYSSLPAAPTTPAIKCPLGYEGLFTMIRVSSDDSCFRDKIDNNCGTRWCDRYEYRCHKNENIIRRFGEACRAILGDTNLNGIMNAEGECRLK